MPTYLDVFSQASECEGDALSAGCGCPATGESQATELEPGTNLVYDDGADIKGTQ